MQTAESEFWLIITAIGTWMAAIATFSAAIVALVAMRSWTKQEKAKAFKSVMMGLRAFLFELESMPSSYSSIYSHTTGSSNDWCRGDAIKLYSRCREAWAGYSVFSKNKNIISSWAKVDVKITDYVYRGKDKDFNTITKLVDELEKQYDLENRSRIKKWCEQ